MLTINRMTDYAVLVMARLARSPDALLRASELAGQTHLSLATVRKILKIMAAHGLLVSSRGRNGGFRLARPPGQLSLAEMIVAMDGPVATTPCCRPNDLCSLSKACGLRQRWLIVDRKLHTLLQETTLEELAAPVEGEPGP